jgi:hypothetical protein
VVGFDEARSNLAVAFIELQIASLAAHAVVPLGLSSSPRIAFDTAVHLIASKLDERAVIAWRVVVINFR